MHLNKFNSKEIKRLIKKATNPFQYDSVDLDWEKEGMSDSPTRQFFYDYLEKNISDLTNKNVIDIGSGTGYLTKLFQKFGAKEIYGIEPSHKNIQISQKFYPKMIVNEVSLEKAKFERKFDVAFVIMVFEHLKDLNSSFHKIETLLKQNGMLYIIVGDKNYHTIKRSGYRIKIKNLRNGEVVAATKRSYGTIYDIFRPIDNFIQAARINNFYLEKIIPLIPTKKLIQAESKYKKFKDRPLCHLLIFKHNVSC